MGNQGVKKQILTQKRTRSGRFRLGVDSCVRGYGFLMGNKKGQLLMHALCQTGGTRCGKKKKGSEPKTKKKKGLGKTGLVRGGGK